MLTSKYKRRFSTLQLDSKDVYVQKLQMRSKEGLQGMLHITAISLVVELYSYEIPLMQYYYQHMFKAPCQDPDFPETIIFSTSMKKTLPDMVIEHISKTKYLEGLEEISFMPFYESPNKVVEIISFYYTKAKANSWLANQTEIIETLKSKIKFDYNQIESLNEKYLIREALVATRVLSYERVPGWFFATDTNIYFQSIVPIGKQPVKKIPFRSVKSILKRKWILKSIGIEIFSNKKSYFLAFPTEKLRDELFSSIFYCLNIVSENEKNLEDMTGKWQQRQISNYSYLLYLNSIANRSFCDYSQYPVFPWVISNYTSEKLDINDYRNYRDLSKPIGALSLERLATLKSRLKEMPEPKFLYGTHYSNPSIIIRWMIRERPLYALKLHDGKYDMPDRIFYDIASEWQSCNTLTSDFKELIPEFYGTNTRFLLNLKKLDLGVRSNGEKISEVKLPKWASSPQEFLEIMRQALESDYVSENLHHWIDLIFGYKQRGEQAIASDNLFHHFTYEGGIDLEAITDLEYKKTLETQIQEYGQTPKQLFKVPHAPRSYIPSIPESITPMPSYWPIENISKIPSYTIKENLAHNKRVSSIHKYENKVVSTGYDGGIVVSKNKELSIHRPILATAINSSGTLFSSAGDNIIVCNLAAGKIVNEFKGHEDRISCIKCASQDIIVTGSWDYSIKLWDVRTTPKPVYQYMTKNEITCVTSDLANPYIFFSGDMQGNVLTTDFRVGLLSSIDFKSYIFGLESLQDGLVVCGTYDVELIRGGQISNYLNLQGVQALATDGKFLVVGKEEEELQMWKFDNGTCLYKWDEINNITCVFSDGYEILAGTIEGIIFQIK